MNRVVIILVCSLLVSGKAHRVQPECFPLIADSIPGAKKDLFEDAVECIKKFEGWHSEKHFPYVGYGHKLQKGETFTANISKDFADSLLRNDLRQKCACFRRFGKDSLLLGVLAYNIGEYRLLGAGKMPKSQLIRKLEKGDRNIYNEYISYSKYKGKIISSLERRRKYEYELLYIE